MDSTEIVNTLLESDLDPKSFAMDLIGQQNQSAAAERATGVVNQRTVGRGQIIYHKTYRNSDGTAGRARITSVKTWKTRPEDFLIGWKHGMYQYGTINPQNASDWTTIEPAQVKPQKRPR